MKIPVSSRLLACAAYVGKGERVADIGCDHGYLGIYLLQNGIAESVIAADIRPIPLESAIRNAVKFGCREKMSFYLSDGVKKIPHDFDTMICAGIGADTMISILASAPWLKNERYRLILQCQSKTHELRRYLSDNGWYLSREAVVRDGRFLYTVMDVVYAPQKPRLSVGEWFFPNVLCTDATVDTAEYYRRVRHGLRLAVSARGEENVPDRAAALRALEALAQRPELSFLKEETV